LADLEKSDWVTGMNDPVLGASIHKKIQGELGKGGKRPELDADILERVEKKLEVISSMAQEVAVQKRRRLDVWDHASLRSKEEQDGFKSNLIGFYDCGDGKDDKQLKCMVTGKVFPRDQVIASHLWKRATEGQGLDEFGLEPDDVDSPRNGLLMLDDIENAFDRKDLCFIYHPTKQEIRLFLLNPNLKNAVITNTALTFGDIDGTPLLGSNRPFRRLLGWHAKCAIHRAFRVKRWIDKIDHQGYDTLLELSEGACFPKDAYFQDDDSAVSMSGSSPAASSAKT